jgi:hypothetical protein
MQDEAASKLGECSALSMRHPSQRVKNSLLEVWHMFGTREAKRAVSLKLTVLSFAVQDSVSMVAGI